MYRYLIVITYSDGHVHVEPWKLREFAEERFNELNPAQPKSGVRVELVEVLKTSEAREQTNG